MRTIFPYRIITGSVFNAKENRFDATVFHMTFWAKDRLTLMYLATIAGCPTGKIYNAMDVYDVSNKFIGPKPIFSAN